MCMDTFEQQIIGIDGGGTSTKARLYVFRDGQIADVIAEANSGSANLNSVSKEQIELHFRQLINDLKPKNAVGVGLGVAGLSTPGAMKELENILLNAGFPSLMSIKGDHEIALRGALGQQSGILLISGTGSICYGQNANGQLARSGGYGYLLDDEGSAFSVGLKMLRYWIQAWDGRILPSPMLNHVTSILSESNSPLHQAMDLAYGPHFDKAKIASLAKEYECFLLIEDPYALTIFLEESEGIIHMVKAVSTALGLNEPKLVMQGGFINHNPTFTRMLYEKLISDIPDLDIVKAEEDAIYGAADFAKELYNARYAG